MRKHLLVCLTLVLLWVPNRASAQSSTDDARLSQLTARRTQLQRELSGGHVEMSRAQAADREAKKRVSDELTTAINRVYDDIRSVQADLRHHATDCDYHQALRKGERVDGSEHFAHIRAQEERLRRLGLQRIKLEGERTMQTSSGAGPNEQAVIAKQDAIRKEIRTLDDEISKISVKKASEPWDRLQQQIREKMESARTGQGPDAPTDRPTVSDPTRDRGNDVPNIDRPKATRPEGVEEDGRGSRGYAVPEQTPAPSPYAELYSGLAGGTDDKPRTEAERIGLNWAAQETMDNSGEAGVAAAEIILERMLKKNPDYRLQIGRDTARGAGEGLAAIGVVEMAVDTTVATVPLMHAWEAIKAQKRFEESMRSGSSEEQRQAWEALNRVSERGEAAARAAMRYAEDKLGATPPRNAPGEPKPFFGPTDRPPSEQDLALARELLERLRSGQSQPPTDSTRTP